MMKNEIPQLEPEDHACEILHGVNFTTETDMIKAIANVAEYIRNQQKWISVKDKLPELEKYVLLFDDWRNSVGERRINIRIGYLNSFKTTKSKEGVLHTCEWKGYEYIFNITHWQPLPIPPTPAGQ